MRITLRQLQHASALARHGSFREAAADMHITQPALTRSIQTLESSLGVSLFDRQTNGVEVSRAGEVLLRRAEGVLESAAGRTIARAPRLPSVTVQPGLELPPPMVEPATGAVKVRPRFSTPFDRR